MTFQSLPSGGIKRRKGKEVEIKFNAEPRGRTSVKGETADTEARYRDLALLKFGGDKTSPKNLDWVMCTDYSGENQCVL